MDNVLIAQNQINKTLSFVPNAEWSYDSYNETLQNQKEKEDKLIKIEQKFESMQEQLQAILVLAFSSLNQEGKNELARKLVTNTTYTAE